jgi:hypothetical protein
MLGVDKPGRNWYNSFQTAGPNWYNPFLTAGRNWYTWSGHLETQLLQFFDRGTQLVLPQEAVAVLWYYPRIRLEGISQRKEVIHGSRFFDWVVTKRTDQVIRAKMSAVL